MVTLKRFAYSPMGTFGILSYENKSWYTLERPWVDNKPHVSCIPEGEYKLKWYDSPKFGKTFAVIGGTVSLFPDINFKRSAILIHPANIMDDLEGCIGLGSILGFIRNKWAIVNSKLSVTEFLELLKNKDNIPFSIEFSKQVAK